MVRGRTEPGLQRQPMRLEGARDLQAGKCVVSITDTVWTAAKKVPRWLWLRSQGARRYRYTPRDPTQSEQNPSKQPRDTLTFRDTTPIYGQLSA